MNGLKRFCTQCGTQAGSDDVFCANCGAKLTSPVQEDSISNSSPYVSSIPESNDTVNAIPDSAVSRNPAPGNTAPGSTVSQSATQQSKKPKGKLKSLLVSVVIIALAWGAGSLIGKEFAKGYNTTATTKSPIVTVVPIAEITKAVLPSATEAPVLTKLPVSTPLPTVTFKAPDVSSLFNDINNKNETYWNYLEADDEEIRDAMTNFWFGTDSSTGAKCAFFADNKAHHGGYYWWKSTSESFKANFVIGTFANTQSGSDILVDADGDKTPITVISRKDGSIDFSFGDSDYIKGTLRLKRDTKNKDQVLKLILNYKHTLEKMGNY